MAPFALISWPFISVWFFRVMTLPVAVATTVIAGYLLLPTQTSFDYPLLPSFNKQSIPALAALAIATIMLRQPRVRQESSVLRGWIPRHPVACGLFLLMFLSAIGTALTNSEPLFYGRVVIPGLRPYDAVSAVVNTVMMLLPFILGRRFIATPDAHRALLMVLVIAGVSWP